jgi:hypothetical protein
MVNPKDKTKLTQSYTSMHQKSLNWGYYNFLTMYTEKIAFQMNGEMLL